MSASLHVAERSSRRFRRHCPARDSPAQNFSTSELQAERTFPLLPQADTQIATRTTNEASNPHLVKLFKSRLDISATPKVVVRWSDGLVSSGGSGTRSSFNAGLVASRDRRAAKQPRWSCRPAAAKRREASAASGFRVYCSPLFCTVFLSRYGLSLPRLPEWNDVWLRLGTFFEVICPLA